MIRRILFTPGQRDKLLRQCKGTYKPLPELEQLMHQTAKELVLGKNTAGSVLHTNGDAVSPEVFQSFTEEEAGSYLRSRGFK